MKKKILIISTTLALLGTGALITKKIMSKRKRRRQLEENEVRVFNKVAEDFGGTVPGSLYKYLKNLSHEETREKGDHIFWGYQRIKDFSGIVSHAVENDVMIVLGENKKLSEEESNPVYLLYTVGYPTSLVHAVREENGDLAFLETVPFDVLF